MILIAVTIFCAAARPSFADSTSRREQLRQRINDRLVKRGTARGANSFNIAGLNVAVWQPVNPQPAPLVIFSHGFHGMNTQSIFLMNALANAGYLVVAPNHRDQLRRHKSNWASRKYASGLPLRTEIVKKTS